MDATRTFRVKAVGLLTVTETPQRPSPPRSLTHAT
jgi:hypothetical protein